MGITKGEVIDEFRQAQAQGGGRQVGGGAEAADQDAAAGSSGVGGYGNAQNQSFHDQGVDQGPTGDAERSATRDLSRGERFDLEQGGGRGDDALDPDDDVDEDQQARRDMAGRFIEDREDGGEA